jgi:hypothetical protein
VTQRREEVVCDDRGKDYLCSCDSVAAVSL